MDVGPVRMPFGRLHRGRIRVIGFNIWTGLENPRRLMSVSKAIELEEVVGPEGHWVVVVDGRVIATSSDLAKMLRLAEKHPAVDTVVKRVLYPKASFFCAPWRSLA